MLKKIKQELNKIGKKYFFTDKGYDTTPKGYYELRRVSKLYGYKKIAKICATEFLDNDLLFYLAFSGNKYTEKYIRKILDENNNEDEIFDCAIGLVALGFEEGVEILKEFAYRRHPFLEEIILSDISDYLKDIDNKLAIKLVEEIESGKYDSYWNIKKDKNPE